MARVADDSYKAVVVAPVHSGRSTRASKESWYRIRRKERLGAQQPRANVPARLPTPLRSDLHQASTAACLKLRLKEARRRRRAGLVLLADGLRDGVERGREVCDELQPDRDEANTVSARARSSLSRCSHRRQAAQTDVLKQTARRSKGARCRRLELGASAT